MFEIDDDDFMPSSSGNLSSIFNASLLSEDNASLSYKAPKQPKETGSSSVTISEQNHDSKTPTQTQSSVLLAKVITLWKLENGQNRLLGKYMVAIIGNAAQQLYEMIVYQKKTDILIRHSLNEALTLYKYPKNFIGIFDNNKQFWNLSFDSCESQGNFLKEVSSHKCQIIEQNYQINTNHDQIDNRTNNLSVSNVGQESLGGKEVKPLIANTDQSKTDDTTAKDKILLRITKMGGQILPKADIIERKLSSELSDSETESSYSDQKPQKPTTAPRKFRRNLNQERAPSTPGIAEKSMLHSPYTSHANQMFGNNNQVMLNTHGMVYAQQYPDYGVNNFIVSQNAELKANLAEINMKLSTVLSSHNGNVDKNGNSEQCDSLKSKIKCMNLKMDNLTTELERSRQELKDLQQNYDLKCSKIVEEQNNNAKWENLIEEVDRLKEELCNMELLKVENEKLTMNINEKEALIESQQLSLQEAKEFSIESKHTQERLAQELENLNLQIDQLTLKTKIYEEELAQKETLSSKIQKDALVLGSEVFDKKIKETMNKTFISIMEEFDENGQYSFREVQKVVLEKLKKATYSLINAIE